MPNKERMGSTEIARTCVHFFLLTLLTLVTKLSLAQESVGERWQVVRGDGSPGLSYSSFVRTPSGRLLAAGSGGQLMLSDDNGTSWRYEVIIDTNGEPLFGNISSMVVVGNQVVASAVRLIESSDQSSGLPFQGQTLILASTNNGNSWSITPFPVAEALLGGARYPGIFLPHLFLAPNGQLLAYGSTVRSNGAVSFFIGGAIFRQTGSGWEQVSFKLGSLASMSTTDGGRLVASGFQTVLDSADGVGWNGYSLADANMVVGAETLNDEIKEGLYASDITFIDNKYVMQTQQFRRAKSNPRVFIAAAERAIIFTSTSPFDGARNWTGTDQTRIYPDWLNMGNRVVSVFGGAFTSSNGVAWSGVDNTVHASGASYGPSGGQGIVVVGNSDEVWRSPDAGQSWNKILDQDPGPDLTVQVRLGNVLLARSGDSIWRSVDNGLTWVEISNIKDQTGRGLVRLRVNGDQLYAAQGGGGQIATSPDGGITWQTISIPSASNQAVSDVVTGQGGRLIVAPQSKSVSNPPATNFYTSDDSGQSWQPHTAPLNWNETPKQGLHVGGGRIVYMMNSFASFGPELVTSNNNGVTWQREDPFQVMEGLNHVSGGSERVIDLKRLVQTRTGRLIILGGSGEIIYSDNRGLSWLVAANYENETVAWLDWDMHDITESGNRLVIAGSRKLAQSSSTKVVFALVSEDDGTTWREIPIPVSQFNTGLYSAVAGADGRVVFGGTNGAVFVSEATVVDEDLATSFSVREGETLTLQIPRPPVGGAITLAYRMSPIDAQPGIDFVQTMGTLTWQAHEMDPKPLLIETIENAVREASKDFTVDFGLNDETVPQPLAVQTADDTTEESPVDVTLGSGPNDGIIVSFNYRITIKDNDGTGVAGIEIIADGEIRTAEDGTESNFGVALTHLPTDDVTLTLSVDISGEVAFQPATLTFTPANWNQVQTVHLTGLDDSERDYNKTVRLMLTPSSNDSAYHDLIPVTAYVVNVDDEVDELIFESGFEAP